MISKGQKTLRRNNSGRPYGRPELCSGESYEKPGISGSVPRLGRGDFLSQKLPVAAASMSLRSSGSKRAFEAKLKYFAAWEELPTAFKTIP